ncbi:uncharacterized protein LOC100183767 [Ciona intestinalis]
MKTLSTLSHATEAMGKLSMQIAQNQEKNSSEEENDSSWTTIHMRKPAKGKHTGPHDPKRPVSCRHQALGRTSSAPVNIPNRRHWKNQHEKKQLTRVSSLAGGISPGGKHRLTYDRDFLLECRLSPLSLSPPSDLPVIPGATAPAKRRPKKKSLEKVDSNISNASAASFTSNVSSATDDEHKPL